MFDNVMRLREPAAWTVLAVTVATIVLAVVRFVLALGAGVPLAAAAQDMSLGAMNLTLVIVIVALVWACVFTSPTPRAVQLVGVAATVVTAGTLISIAGTLVGASASAGALGVVLEVLGGLLDIVLKIVATITLWLILRGMRGGRIAGPAVAALPEPQPEPQPEPEPPADADADPAAEQGVAPIWRPDPTAGSVWASAQDAAQGAPGAGAAQDGGWHPVRRPDSPIEAPRID